VNDLCFDTCFLIDLERELRRGAAKAFAFVAAHREVRFWISWTVAGEFAEGFSDIRQQECAALLARFDVLTMEEPTAGAYARIARELRQKRQMIGANDLGIAAAALVADFPLVTNNAAHFGRVAGLEVIAY